jgi:hypothetical protein
VAARTALLVFRDGEPTLLRFHFDPDSMLMLTLASFLRAMVILDESVGQLRGLIAESRAFVAARAVRRDERVIDDRFMELNVSTRNTIRDAWDLVESTEMAMQVALVALVEPSGAYDPVRWHEDVATWAAWVTRIIRGPLLRCGE